MKKNIIAYFSFICLLSLMVFSSNNVSLAACSPPVKIVGDTYGATSIQDAYDYAYSVFGQADFTLRLSGEILPEDLILDKGSVILNGGYDCSFTSKTASPTGIYGTLTISTGTANIAGDIAIVSTDRCDFDSDLDGFTSIGSCLGSANDCNDSDPNIYPGAAEICDGIDNNCNGQIDEEFIPVDADGDGYSGPGSCGTVEDCDDNDASIHPGALDIPYDGIDQDCSGTDMTFDAEICLWCHIDPLAYNGMHSLVTAPDTSCAGCHNPLVANVLPGHYGRTVLTDGNGVTAGSTIVCESCHDASSPNHAGMRALGNGTDEVWGKVMNDQPAVTCDTCHESRAFGHETTAAHDNRIIDSVCATCHTSDTTNLGSPGTGTLLSAADVDTLHRSDCALCHSYIGTAIDPATVRLVIRLGVSGTPMACNDCHGKGDDHLNHDHSATISASADCVVCHDDPQIVPVIHSGNCALCHSSPRTEVRDAINSGQAECLDCHVGHDHSNVTATPDCAVCHNQGNPLDVDIVPIHNGSCATCHASSRQDVIDVINSGQGECIDCHTPHDDLVATHNNLSAPASCAVCHTDKVTGTDFAYILNYHVNPALNFTEIEKCQRCHNSTRPEVISTIIAGRGANGVPVTCADCHVSQHVPIVNPIDLHQKSILTNFDSNCNNCHIENFRSHIDMIATTDCSSTLCHPSANQDEYNTLHLNDCLVCHLSPRTEVISMIYDGVAGTPVECISCHDPH